MATVTESASAPASHQAAANAPAQALYRSLGYRPHGGYHLRVKD